MIDQNGFLGLRSDGDIVARHGERLHPWRWYFVGMTAATGPVVTPMLFVGGRGRTGGPLVAEGTAFGCLPDPPGDLWVGTIPATRPRRGIFDGKVSGIRCYSAQLDVVALMDIMNGFDAVYSDRLRGYWDLSICADLDRVVDVSGHNLHGHALNAPCPGSYGPPLCARLGTVRRSIS